MKSAPLASPLHQLKHAYEFSTRQNPSVVDGYWKVFQGYLYEVTKAKEALHGNKT